MQHDDSVRPSSGCFAVSKVVEWDLEGDLVQEDAQLPIASQYDTFPDFSGWGKLCPPSLKKFAVQSSAYNCLFAIREYRTVGVQSCAL
jgi:hypothetical protein